MEVILNCKLCGKQFVKGKEGKGNCCSVSHYQIQRRKERISAQTRKLPSIEEVVDFDLDAKMDWIRKMNEAGNKVTFADIQRVSTEKYLKNPQPVKANKVFIPMYDEDLLADNIKYLIEGTHLKYTAVGKDLGFAAGVLINIADGVRKVTVGDLIKFAEYFQVPAEDLLSIELGELEEEND